MTVLDDLAALPGRIAQEVAEATAMPRLAAIRAALNESGIRAERRAVNEAPERIDEAQAELRAARVAEADAKAIFDAETLVADWDLDRHFVSEGNKTFLVIEGGAERRQMTADERARWKAAEAAKQPAVKEAAARLRLAEHATAAARDALATAERRFSAAKAALTAAVAELQALGIGIAAEPAPTATTNDNGGNHR